MKNYELNEFLVECTQLKEGEDNINDSAVIDGYEVQSVVISDGGEITLTLREYEDRPVVTNIEQISLPQLNLNDIEAKVDTGAEMCCLHAEEISVNGDTVTFISHGKRISMTKCGEIDIQTADHGVEGRPVIKLNVIVNDVEVSNVEFNLNDRGEMPNQILLGKNILQAGDFLVDPVAGEETADAV